MEFLRVETGEMSCVFVFFLLFPTPVPRLYCYRSTMVAAVSRQVPKTLREGTLLLTRGAAAPGAH